MGSQVSFPGGQGKTLVEQIRDKLDIAYDDVKSHWPEPNELEKKSMQNSRQWGRVEGVAAALGILRSSSTKYEIEQAKERHERNQ